MSSESNSAENSKTSTVYSFAPFGYEGRIVSVEVDLRPGLPAVDVVGLADSSIKESRERMKSAIEKSGFEFPAERVLISLSPADLKKEGASYDLPLALAVLGEGKGGEPVFAMGELGLDGGVRSVRALQGALESAREEGIKNFIVPEGNRKELEGFKFAEDEKIKFVSNLREAVEKDYEYASKFSKSEYRKDTDIVFTRLLPSREELNDTMKAFDGKYKNLRALEIAAAGKHNILAVGAPGSGRSLLMNSILPLITPDMTENEAVTTNKIRSIAGLDISAVSVKDNKYEPPFRSPHQYASIEGMCGGGPNCRPGEISLAHNGVLFFDEAAEFRTSVLQMMRVPIENGKITLSRAGRSTVFPADFQLAMATSPCPCGNAGSESHICICSSRAIDMYWKKFSSPLLDRIQIKTWVDEKADLNDTRKASIEEMRGRVAAAMKIQRERGVYNQKLSPAQMIEYCKLSEADEKKFAEFAEKNDLSPRQRHNILKVSLTIANMDGREKIMTQDLAEACELVATPVNPLEMNKEHVLFENGKQTQSSNAVEAQGSSRSDEINQMSSKEEKTMALTQKTKGSAATEQTALNVSDKHFSGNGIPYQNAKLIKEAMEKGTAPFIPDQKGNINARPIYNANTGFCLNAKDLIPMQIKNPGAKYVVTKSTIDAMELGVKKGERGTFYNFKRQDGSIGTTQYFTPDQLTDPDKAVKFAEKKVGEIRQNGLKSDFVINIDSPEPKEYLAGYLAACKTNSSLKCSPAVAEEFKKNFGAVLENQMHTFNGHPTKKFNAEIGKLNELLLAADQKSVEIVKEINEKNLAKENQKQQEKKPRKQEKEMSR